jgi:mono/diheme cytochrome c family protein
VTGPNLDQIGEVTPQRVRNAIKVGGTGQNRMPAGLLEGQEAAAVAAYVSKVAGK